jgi:hypothetical protein
MARQDIAGLLTGMPTQRPDPSMNREQWAMAFGQQQADRVGQGLRGLTGATTVREQAGIADLKAQERISALATSKDPAELRQAAQLLQQRGDPAGAARAAAQAKAIEDKKVRSEAITGVFKKEFPERPDLIKMAEKDLLTVQDLELFRAEPPPMLYLTNQIQGSIGNAVLKDGKIYLNGNEVSIEEMEKRKLSVTKNFVDKPKAGDTTIINNAALGSKIALEQYKIDATVSKEQRDKAVQAYNQYIPVIDNMLAVKDVADFGAGTPQLAAANNALTSLSNQLGFEVMGDSTKDAVLFFNANSKLLKQRLLEATKGAISNLENTEITKNTANTSQPEQVAIALLNSSRASLVSSNDRANAQDRYLRKNSGIGGFDEAWQAYVKEFPRTAGYSTEGPNNEVVNNFEMVKGNFGLFEELYSNKKTPKQLREPVKFVDNNNLITDLPSAKQAYIDDRVKKVMSAASLTGAPSDAVKKKAELYARIQFGQYIRRDLDAGNLKVVQ